MNQLEKRQKWALIIEQHKQSQLSIKDFCHQQAISYQTFYYWSKRLNETPSEKQIAQAIVIDDDSHQSVTVTLQNGLHIELPCNLSKSQIQTWIDALQ